MSQCYRRSGRSERITNELCSWNRICRELKELQKAERAREADERQARHAAVGIENPNLAAYNFTI